MTEPGAAPDRECQDLNFRFEILRRSVAMSTERQRSRPRNRPCPNPPRPPPASRAAAARRAAPPAPSARMSPLPYITRNIPLTEILERRGARNHRAQRRDAARGDRHRVPRLSRARSSSFAAPARRQGRARALSARPRATALRHDAAALRPARAQSRAQRRHRRQRDGVRAELRLALRPRPRQGPPLRHDRGLPQFREARLSEPLSSTIPAARCASRSTCRSTSGISRWSMPISNIPTSRSWAR